MPTSFLPLRAGGGDDEEGSLPFKIYIRKGEKPNQYFRGVEFNSLLYENLNYQSKLEIIGLLGSSNREDTDPGWKSFDVSTISDKEPLKIWLQIEFDTESWPKIKIAELKDSNDPKSDFLSKELEYIEIKEVPKQKYAKLMLGIINKNGDNKPIITQYVSSNLRLGNTVSEAKTSDGSSSRLIGAKFPFPV